MSISDKLTKEQFCFVYMRKISPIMMPPSPHHFKIYDGPNGNFSHFHRPFGSEWKGVLEVLREQDGFYEVRFAGKKDVRFWLDEKTLRMRGVLEFFLVYAVCVPFFLLLNWVRRVRG